jgi:pSer/pThr/pTyr-binding forkhead associated (FHA) protein
MNLFKQTPLTIQLELNGRTLYEISSEEVKSEITVGRSERCAWRIPSEDRSASGVHARIFLNGKKVMIEDMKSRNGIYFMGSKIQKRKLAPGDVYGIGDCKLTVEYDVRSRKKNVSQEKYHKLEQLTGENRGKVYVLKEDYIKIGAAPECFIVLNDSLVSKLHAVLESHSDDTCWVKDMGSRNGTKVNGTPLTEENAQTGRMLKDGDIISIAYMDFRFWDKTVVHIRSHLFLKIGVVAATLAIVLGGYFAFQVISPSAKSIRLSAEKRAAAGDFAGAKEILLTATTARGADSDASQRLDLVRKLAIWQETCESWEKIQSLLSGSPGVGALYEANDLFGVITSADRERWQWNVSTAAVEMRKAQETHALLSTLLGIEDRITHTDEDIAYINENRSRLKDALEACRKNPQPYQTAIQAEAADLLGEMDFQISENDEIQSVISGCNGADKLDQTIERLEKIREKASDRIEQRKKDGKSCSQCSETLCKKLLAVLRDLQTSRKLFDENCLAAAQFEFGKIQSDLHLPSAEDCILAPNLSLCRLELDQDNQHLKQIAIQLLNFQTFFKDNEFAPGHKSPMLDLIFDQEAWETKILACDCLKVTQPSYTEKTARSEYDRVLGVYAFWEYLRSIGGDFDTTVFEDRFKPDLFRAKEIFNHLDTFLLFCDPLEKSPLRKVMRRLVAENDGKSVLADHIKIAKTIILKRDTLIDRMYECYQENSEFRDGIIAGGVAICLLPDDWTDFKPEELEKGIGDSLKKLRAKLASLNEQGLDTTPEQRMENEKKMLQIGIPGDAFLKQPWSDHVTAVTAPASPSSAEKKAEKDDDDDEEEDD